MAASDPFAFEREQTTHYSVVDAEGFAVACTTTLNGSFGCGVTVDGAGFLLNNEMDDFTAAPGTPNQYGLIQSAANAVGPRKRPLSAMTPTIVSRDGQVVMVIGSPGGPTIINTVLLALIAVLDDGASIEQAVARPRFHHQWWLDRIDCEKDAFPEEVAAALRERGHVIRVRGLIGDAHGITVDRRRGLICGAADPRRGGAAAGW
jgi:gamma-glutamyltranspeptidase/glutathione hydrolase